MVRYMGNHFSIMTPLCCPKMMEMSLLMAKSMTRPPYQTPVGTVEIFFPPYHAILHVFLLNHLFPDILSALASIRDKVNYVMDVMQQIQCIDLWRDYPTLIELDSRCPQDIILDLAPSLMGLTGRVNGYTNFSSNTLPSCDPLGCLANTIKINASCPNTSPFLLTVIQSL
jgi:hypothetical protein